MYLLPFITPKIKCGFTSCDKQWLNEFLYDVSNGCCFLWYYFLIHGYSFCSPRRRWELQCNERITRFSLICSLCKQSDRLTSSVFSVLTAFRRLTHSQLWYLPFNYRDSFVLPVWLHENKTSLLLWLVSIGPKTSVSWLVTKSRSLYQKNNKQPSSFKQENGTRLLSYLSLIFICLERPTRCLHHDMVVILKPRRLDKPTMSVPVSSLSIFVLRGETEDFSCKI